MRIEKHADHTEKIVGIRAEDIHKWIDGLFDAENFELFFRHEISEDYDPYEHRKFRHCRESLPEAYEEFEGKYTKKQIKAVFETHIKDDYNGYIPIREDFENGTFKEKYHDREDYSVEEKILSNSELKEYFQGKTEKKNEKRFQKTLSQGFLFRIVLPTIIAIILFVTTIFIIVVPISRTNMMNSKKEMIKELTATAISSIHFYSQQEKAGFITIEEAKKKAISLIDNMRYGEENKDYFWITDMYPKMIMHPYNKNLIGTDLSDYRDQKNKSGIKLFLEFVNIVKKDGEGYLKYWWQWKDDSSQIVPKLSYVKGIPEWGWIIGTGVYINDVEDEIIHIRNKLLWAFAIISIGLILILINVIIQSHKIESNKLRAETGLKEAKDRYRAFVESSNEGYILELEGVNIFSNVIVNRLFGYTEQEIGSKKIWELLTPDVSINDFARKHLQEMLYGKTNSKSFEAQIMTKNGRNIDVIISTSSIFLSKKNGHVISIKPIVHKEADEILKNYGSTQIFSEAFFASKPISKICRVLTKNELTTIDENQDFIKENTPAYLALRAIENSNNNEILVKNNLDKPIGMIGYKEFARDYVGLPFELIKEIEESNSVGHVIHTLNRVPLLIREMSMYGAKPDALRSTIGKMFEASIKSFINFSIETLGKPPIPFAFVSLGSNARHEMTMFSDQDNALIFADPEAEELEKVRRYFLKLSDGVCSKLNKAGYPYCPGGIMAVNPKWCLSLSEWKAKFSDWIKNATKKSILEVNIFLDIKNVFGKKSLTDDLFAHIFELIRLNPQFFIHISRNCLSYKTPINLLGNIRTETRDGIKTINIKEYLKPLEIIARIYALKNAIQEPSSEKRLEILIKKNDDPAKKSFKEMQFVFDYLWRTRFSNQIITHADLRRVNDELDLKTLSDIERLNLKNVLSKISDFQTMLSFDILGGER